MSSPMITTTNLTFSYNKKRNNIKNLDLKVPKGSIYGFLGRNGSGKTTTIRLLLGLLRPQSGEIKLFGETYEKNQLLQFSKIGALIEKPSLYGHLTGRENLAIIAAYHKLRNTERINEVLQIVDLEDFGNKKVREYSLGMKQRLGIAICLLNSPQLLILDEPINGLDPQGILEMRKLFKALNEKEGTTIFLSSHILSEIEKICSHFGIIKEGEMVFQGSVKDFQRSREENIKIDIETSDLCAATELLRQFSVEASVLSQNHLRVLLKKKDDIPVVIDCLREQNIDVFELKIQNDLENFFLNRA